MWPRYLPAGDTALIVELGDAVDPETNARVLALDAEVVRAALPGVVETVPTYRSLMVHYDPAVVGYRDLVARLERLEPPDHPAARGRLWTIPVVYGGPFGPDLEEVAAGHGLTPDAVVARHAAVAYRVYMIGFSPGFAYLGGLDPALATSRRADPRLKVPGGSVSIGGVQTGISSIDAPSGWNLLGRTPVRLYDPRRAAPFLLAAGDQVRFEPTEPSRWADLAARAQAGETLVRAEAA